MVQVSKPYWEQQLAPFGQQHLLQFWDELNEAQRAQLARELSQLDLPLMKRLRDHEDAAEDWQQLAARAESPTAFRLGDPTNPFSVKDARRAADELLSAGKVGVILVAGGQGTRLGFPHPKGMFAIGPVTNRSLFQMHVEQLLAVSERYGRRIPLYLMTSPATHDETLAYFDENQRFGLPAEDLHVFCQGTMPAVDDAGRMLLDSKDSLALSPDGHGGMLAALKRTGCLADMQRRGLEQLFYFQVDNPLVPVCDRDLLGYHQLAGAEMSTLVVAKTDPLEKVGNVVRVDGALQVIEYSDLPASAAQRRDAKGNLVLWAGSIAVHGLSVAFLTREADSADGLPFHRARKKVPYLNELGERVEPREPNATKYERFIFDLMPSARGAIVVEGAVRDVFAPLKNASGAATDTPETTRAALVAKFTRWLNEAGATVESGVAVEIAPRLALDGEELRQRVQLPLHITAPKYLDRTA